MTATNHQWRFFSAGDFEQPILNSAADLAALAQLDQKLWATLACPTNGLYLSDKFLQMLDANADQRIRAPEVIDAVNWTLARLTDPDCLFTQRPLTLADFQATDATQKMILAAQRLLELLGRSAEDGLSAEDTRDASIIFPANKPNGDGLIPLQITNDKDLQSCISQIIQCLGAQKDRSGEDAISAEQIDEFFRQAQSVKDWYAAAADEVKQPFAENTSTVISLIARLKDKINDYFTRVELAAYDTRAVAIMAASEDELARLSTSNLSQLDSLKDLPLANLQQGEQISFKQGLNPAWSADMCAFYEAAVVPKWGEIEALTRAQWQELLAQSADYFAWQAIKPQVAILASLDLEAILALDCEHLPSKLHELVAKDLRVAEAAQGWMDLDKLLNMQEHLVPFLRNFVSFADFYGRQDLAIFQAGRLYIDGKSCDLVVEVDNIDAHSSIATQSNSFLIYCRCVRRGQPVKGREECRIVALVSAGTDHELMIGRNGLFYDRDGNDWDATVVKIIENAISVREAFWSPYRRVANLVSEQIQKFAAGEDQKLVTKATENLSNGSPAPFDIAKFAGIFAALGLAVGAIGTAFAAAFSGLLALHWWQWPLVIIGLIAVISGPSMLLAWFKLRRRSLGPILDANGWAVNAMAKISINFGTSLTQIASLPKGTPRSLADPFARKSSSRWLIPLIIVALGAAVTWYCLAGPGAQSVTAEAVVIEQTASGE